MTLRSFQNGRDQNAGETRPRKFGILGDTLTHAKQLNLCLIQSS